MAFESIRSLVLSWLCTDMSKTTFSWRNLTRPTPKNLEYFAAAVRRLVAVMAGTTIVMEASKWLTFWILMIGALLDELKNFFAYAAEGEQEVFQVSVPTEIADQVEITQKTVDPKKEEGKA